MMRKSFIYLGIVILLAIGCQNSTSQKEEPAESPKDELTVAKETYEIYCASCHGLNLEGASAEGLIKTTWDYGGTKDSLFISIQKGIPAVSMPAYEYMIEKDKIEALVNYIIDAQESSKTGE